VYLTLIRGKQEIKLFGQLNYDPGFQQYIRLREKIMILPGDKIMTICAYNTSMVSNMIHVIIIKLISLLFMLFNIIFNTKQIEGKGHLWA